MAKQTTRGPQPTGGRATRLVVFLFLSNCVASPIVKSDMSVTASPKPEDFPLPRVALGSTPRNDADGDCLDDELEYQVAQHFVPQFIFDSRENALGPSEPIVLYRVASGMRQPHCGALARATITYAYLFADDGGYATSCLCNDRHAGDNQSVRINLKVEHQRLAVQHIQVGRFEFPRDRMEVFEGTHAVVYLSAGKHHSFLDTRGDGQASPYSDWGCRDGVDGKGRRVLPSLEHQGVPRSRLNVGEPNAHSREAFVSELGPLGFPGDFAWSRSPFCGGHGPNCGTATSSMWQIWR